MSKPIRQLVSVLLVAFTLLPLVATSIASAAANTKPNIFVATGWPQGNWKFNIVVGDTPGTSLYLYVDDGNSYQATTNSQGWATFKRVDLSGGLYDSAMDGKLSFTKVVNGNQKPINYTQRYYSTSNKVSFSALYVHPTIDVNVATNECDSDSTPYVVVNIQNTYSHDMAYDITVATYNAAGKQVGSAEGVYELMGGQSLPYQRLFNTSGNCGTTASLKSINAYDDTNDNGQPNF